jgi:hypothetical protein
MRTWARMLSPSLRRIGTVQRFREKMGRVLSVFQLNWYRVSGRVEDGKTLG